MDNTRATYTAMSQPNGAIVTAPEEEDEDHVTEHVTNSGNARETQCGLGPWRPSWLQRGNNMATFTAVLSCWSLFGSMNFSYYSAVISQIEKAYGLSSSMTGFLKNVDNIGYVCFVLVFSHFCRYANKPRLFSVATVCSSVAIFLFAVPHFIWGMESFDAGVGTDADKAAGAGSGVLGNATRNPNANATVSTSELCDAEDEMENQVLCSNLRYFTFVCFSLSCSSLVLSFYLVLSRFSLLCLSLSEFCDPEEYKHGLTINKARTHAP